MLHTNFPFLITHSSNLHFHLPNKPSPISYLTLQFQIHKLMETRRRSNLITILSLIVLSTVAIGEALTPQYYWQSCPSVQEIVRQTVQQKIKETVVTIPATLRLFFHDSFVTVLFFLLLFLTFEVLFSQVQVEN